MATKFEFGDRPKTFKHKVTWTQLDGQKVELAVEFNTRTRKQFGELFDSMLADAKAARGDVETSDMSLAEIMDTTGGNNAKYILAAVASWGVKDDLNLANAQRFADEYPAGANAVMETYRTACVEGRLGN